MVLEKSLALQCWGPKRLNQDGGFEVELRDLGNPSLGGGSKHKGAEGPAVSKKQWRGWHGSHSLGRRIGKEIRMG